MALPNRPQRIHRRLSSLRSRSIARPVCAQHSRGMEVRANSLILGRPHSSSERFSGRANRLRRALPGGGRSAHRSPGAECLSPIHRAQSRRRLHARPRSDDFIPRVPQPQPANEIHSGGGDEDSSQDLATAQTIWNSVSAVLPASQCDFLEVVSDSYGTPAQLGNHWFPLTNGLNDTAAVGRSRLQRHLEAERRPLQLRLIRNRLRIRAHPWGRPGNRHGRLERRQPRSVRSWKFREPVNPAWSAAAHVNDGFGSDGAASSAPSPQSA